MKQTSFFRRVLLAAALSILLTVGAAASGSSRIDCRLPLIRDGHLPKPVSAVALQSVSPDDCLYEGLLQHQTQIDVSEFDLHISSASVLMEAMIRVINDHPELTYVTADCCFLTDEHTGQILSVLPGYTDTEPEEDETEELLAEILALIDSSWSDLEKVLFINDYLTSNFEYDTTFSIYDMESFLKEGRGVCQAYYLTCRALLNELGIPSCSATSNRENHIWNVVCLDGSWYHLDTTWNDPLNDQLGLARHSYFLLSTEELHWRDQTLNPYYPRDRTDFYTDRPVSCTDTTYDSRYWADVDTPYVYLNGSWYYSDSDAICRTADPRIKGTSVISHGIWPMIGSSGSWWMGAFTGLGACGDWLIYNTADRVCAYRPSDGARETIYESTYSDRSIFSLLVRGDSVTCSLAQFPGDPQPTLVTCSLAHLTFPKDRVTLFRGLKIYEGSGYVTVVGKPNTAEPFFLAAAGYDSSGKLREVKLLSSAALTGGTVQWKLPGDDTRVFLLNPDHSPAAD